MPRYISGMSKHLTPIQVAERILGGIERVATICGRHPKAGYIWRRGSSSRAPGDLPDTGMMRTLLDYCEARSLPLDPVWLIRGAPSEVIDAALHAADAEADSQGQAA